VSNQDYIDEIARIKEKCSVTIVAHFYQKDEVFALADLSGDSLQLARMAMEDKNKNLVFCGVGFMGESVKVLSPQKRVVMPKLACCAMARMIDGEHFDISVALLEKQGIKKEDILPITYINSSADVKARVGMMGGMVCTSSNAKKIIDKGLESGKKILFVPDKCLGENIARINNLKSCVIGDGTDPKNAEIICYNGFCSVHQLFSVEDIEFYRAKYPGIKIVTHPECPPDVCIASDFMGSTSQIINYIKELPADQKVAVGTEFNLVNRLREKNTYILSSTKPECPTMNETTVEDLYHVIKSIEDGSYKNEVFLKDETAKWAKIALERMFEV